MTPVTRDKPAFSVCVYCGSRPGVEPAYAEVAQQVGRWIAKHHGQLVYGGGHNGLMGLMADACLQAGGRVIGVIPKALVDKEWAHTGCTELYVVDTMHERKRTPMLSWRCPAASALSKSFLKSGLGASWATTTSRLDC
jgi:uncharacterized protein (TIGR00730 family)